MLAPPFQIGRESSRSDAERVSPRVQRPSGGSFSSSATRRILPSVIHHLLPELCHGDVVAQVLSNVIAIDAGHKA